MHRVFGAVDMLWSRAAFVTGAKVREVKERERERERERIGERESVSSALVFSPSFRRAVPACCTELQGNTSPCISALCTTYRSDCVCCSVGTAVTVFTSFFSE